MADNPPAPNTGPRPSLPGNSTTGRLKNPTTQLPNRKGGAGKIVVMLSSVAKPPPGGTQALPTVVPPSGAVPKPVSADDSSFIKAPPPLPPKQVSPGKITPPSQPRLSTTTYVKLPPKTIVPGWSSLTGAPAATPAADVPAANKITPPPLPPKTAEPGRPEHKKSGAQHIPPIKLNEPSTDGDFSGESIFLKSDQPAPAQAPKPDAGKSVPAAGPTSPVGEPQSLDTFERSHPSADKPGPTPATAPAPEAKDKAAPLVAPPLLPPQRLKASEPLVMPPPSSSALQPLLPPPVVVKPAESHAPSSHVLHMAPPLLEKAPEPSAEKLPPPHHLVEARKEEVTPEAPASSEPAALHKVPALIQSELPPAKPLLPPTAPAAKMTGNWLKKTSPLVLSSTSKVQPPKIAEAKPALMPAVLPKRLQPPTPDPVTESPATPPVAETPVASVTTKAPESKEGKAPETPVPAAIVLPTQVPASEALPAVEKGKDKAEAKVSLPGSPAATPITPKSKTPVPLTRAERAQKRQFWSLVTFWAFIFPLAIAGLFWGSLQFGRDTRVEGQVIPPQGMTLSNEVWIVTDFRSLASGIAEDLAAERTPLMQEIQERQDHVQRAQADVAAREERIRLIQEQIQAAKDEAVAIVKQSRDATQQVWDVDGAQIDAEYTSRLHQLQTTIANRAKSLNLKYQPDDTYQSPEVWANAYRLALYEVPAGVDSVKEHTWLGDQMKLWRDFEKSLDDRKEQLREKAAQIKLAPASKITDLNSKMDELQQRIEATQTEEVPLKAELQQAQTDLVQAQSADAGLDDKYYKQLDSLPAEAVTKHIPLAANGRLTWVDDDVFIEGEKEKHYWLFARATRPDGRQYWALHHFSISKNQTLELVIEPTGFISTKAILRPNLSPEEQEQ